MAGLFNPAAPKKAANLSINSDLLKKARALGINLSSVFESALTVEVRRRVEEQWKEDNREAIEAMNSFTEEHGLFSDEFRQF